ncbi:MAG: FTR1 family protein [Chloroflexi bacterium]|nr:FTR1 family protein [Chloroflexota bacterium]
MRAALARAQTALPRDAAGAARLVAEARAAYAGDFAHRIAITEPKADERVRVGLAAAEGAAVAADAAELARARAEIWTALLAGGLGIVESALIAGDGATAQAWLPLREFRRATRFSRPNADATLAVEAVVAGSQSGPQALPAVRTDLLDTYQARLSATLADLSAADAHGFAARRAELSGLVAGYAIILAPSFAEQRGAPALAVLDQQIAALSAAAHDGQGLPAALAAVEETVQGFRAAPLSNAEQTRRAGQLLRFLALVPVEYSRGVSNGAVTQDLEIREAATFRDGAAAAFADLQPALTERDAAATEQVAVLLKQLAAQIDAAGVRRAVAEPRAIQAAADQALTLLRQAMPSQWQQRDTDGDFDVIDTVLDQMETAVAGGQYELAESARLEAYAVLESGPEARLVVFAPDYKVSLEGLFWYGHGERPGLASLLAARAPTPTVKAARRTLDAELAAAQRALGGGADPVSAATNAGVIVFREGLEAVLILASLMAGLRFGAQRALRRPLWWGVIGALIASALTWLLAHGVLTALGRYGERLEAVVSLIAIAVLLLITNWFFHDAYWVGWMASFHGQKRRLLGRTTGQWVGLAMLGFTSVYREGFETVLFLQALVLEAGLTSVLIGTAAGLAATVAIGILVFAVQAKLPAKRLLIVTGVLIGAVLLVMVGNTTHVLQVVGWLPITPIRWLTLPAWMGLWFGFYPTWEGIGLQIAAAAFVIGSYVIAEQLRHRRRTAPVAQPATEQAPVT